jgi:hypothetical protein
LRERGSFSNMTAILSGSSRVTVFISNGSDHTKLIYE